MTIAETGDIRMPTLPPTPAEVARAYGITADFLAKKNYASEIDRFVEDYMTFAYDLPEDAQDTVRTSLTVARILAVSYNIPHPDLGEFAIDSSFYEAPHQKNIANAWIIANDMHEGILLQKGANDAIHIVVTGTTLANLLFMYPEFRHAVHNPGGSLRLHRILNADAYGLTTTPRGAVEAIAFPK